MVRMRAGRGVSRGSGAGSAGGLARGRRWSGRRAGQARNVRFRAGRARFRGVGAWLEKAVIPGGPAVPSRGSLGSVLRFPRGSFRESPRGACGSFRRGRVRTPAGAPAARCPVPPDSVAGAGAPVPGSDRSPVRDTVCGNIRVTSGFRPAAAGAARWPDPAPARHGRAPPARTTPERGSKAGGTASEAAMQ